MSKSLHLKVCVEDLFPGLKKVSGIKEKQFSNSKIRQLRGKRGKNGKKVGEKICFFFSYAIH
jgi:hypothetical protein